MKISSKKRIYYFFIGTEAELIKLFPVLQRFSKESIRYKIILTGQNNLENSLFFKFLKDKKPEIILSKKNIKQTPIGLLYWFTTTLLKGIKDLKKEFSDKKKSDLFLIIHGDTVTTVMGALIGKLYGLRIVHIEAGLRSFNVFQPFPEEIDRLIASRLSDIHFCPNEWSVKNLNKKNGLIINTFNNTLIDSLQFALRRKGSDLPEEFKNFIKKRKYFIFILHRQENLLNQKLVLHLINLVSKMANNVPCYFVIHKPTELILDKYNIVDKINNNKNIYMSSKLPYFSFVKLLKNSEFIITDGGSNQEEAYYFGKPCLILRSHTERTEGLGENVILSKNNQEIIDRFFSKYKTYKRKPIYSKVSPSKIIFSNLINYNPA